MQLLEIYLHKIQKYINLNCFLLYLFLFKLMSNLNQETIHEK